MSALSLKDLNFHYSSLAQPTLQKISLEIEAGQMTVILGPNGSGKTTLLKLLLGLLRPQKGQILLDGCPLEEMSARERAQKMAYLPQNSPARHQIAVSEVIKMGRYPWRSRFSAWTGRDQGAYERAVILAGVEALLKRNYLQLSGGERQRVLLARAICQETPWLLLDEASANLDLAHQIEIFNVLKTLQEEGLSIVAVLHDINLAARYGQESIFLKDGQLMQKTDPSDPFAAADLSRLYNLNLQWLTTGPGRRHLIWD